VRTLWIALAGLGLSCGSDAPPPVPPQTTVTWVFDSYPMLGIPEGDSCTDLGVAQVEIDAVGPDPQRMTANCSDRQVVFNGLTPGAYTMNVSPLDGSGMLLTKAPVQVPANAADTDTRVDVNVPYDAWTTAYKGSFYFKITWGGMDCTTAMPVVTTQIVALSEAGTPVMLKNDTGHKVDGSDPEPCRGGTTAVEFVSQVPFGPATIAIDGKDTGGVVQYTKTFDTFVGAGLSNPTIQYDVPGPPDAPLPDAMPTDGGVDGMLDAM
jgi:hypothetical protein